MKYPFPENSDAICIEDVLPIARVGSIHALRRMGRDWKTEDCFEDMVQAACCQILSRATRKNASYAFVCAYRAAQKEWFRWNGAVRPGYPEAGMIVLLALENMRNVPADEDVLPIRAQDIYKLMLHARKRHGGKRAKEAAMRDTYICISVMQGYTNEEIGADLRQSRSNINSYRKQIRRVLKQNLSA
jgi:DNA-binding CsgD family transcriptional regulator